MSLTPNSSPAVSPWRPLMVRIREVKVEIPKVFTYRLESELEEIPQFAPGQFNMIYLPGIGEAAISISSGVKELPQIAHTVRIVGSVTEALSRLQVGDQLGLRGPFGNSWPLLELRGNDILVVAGGIGLAPLRPLIDFILRNRSAFGLLKLIYGAKTPRDLLYQKEFRAWEQCGWEVETTVDRGTPDWHGHIGVVTELMRQFPVCQSRTRVLACGPEIMMRFVAREAMSWGGRSSADLCFLGTEYEMRDGDVRRLPTGAGVHL